MSSSAHAVDFLGDMLDVGLSERPLAQQIGLLAAPVGCVYKRGNVR
jgi:hypothetical protein